MKALFWIAWISASVGTVILLLGIISGMLLPRPYLGMVTHVTTFFNAANSFFLLTIALFIFLYRCKCKKE